MTALLAVILGYLLGSFSGTRLVGRFVAPGEDLTTTTIDAEDGPVTLRGTGATAIAVRAGPALGCLTSLLDIAKAAMAVLVARWIWPETDLGLVAGAAAVWGHVFPAFHRFRGGKGMSPILGATLVADWLTVPIASAVGILVGGLGAGDMFLAYGSGPFWMIPLLAWRLGVAGLWFGIAINLPYWWALRREAQEHYANVISEGRSMTQRRSALLNGLRSGLAAGRAPWSPPGDDSDS